eukprot:15469742-Alexandrium_andersonii.AAC.1
MWRAFAESRCSVLLACPHLNCLGSCFRGRIWSQRERRLEVGRLSAPQRFGERRRVDLQKL